MKGAGKEDKTEGQGQSHRRNGSHGSDANIPVRTGETKNRSENWRKLLRTLCAESGTGPRCRRQARGGLGAEGRKCPAGEMAVQSSVRPISVAKAGEAGKRATNERTNPEQRTAGSNHRGNFKFFFRRFPRFELRSLCVKSQPSEGFSRAFCGKRQRKKRLITPPFRVIVSSRRERSLNEREESSGASEKKIFFSPSPEARTKFFRPLNRPAR